VINLEVLRSRHIQVACDLHLPVELSREWFIITNVGTAPEADDAGPPDGAGQTEVSVAANADDAIAGSDVMLPAVAPHSGAAARVLPAATLTAVTAAPP